MKYLLGNIYLDGCIIREISGKTVCCWTVAHPDPWGYLSNDRIVQSRMQEYKGEDTGYFLLNKY